MTLPTEMSQNIVTKENEESRREAKIAYTRANPLDQFWARVKTKQVGIADQLDEDTKEAEDAFTHELATTLEEILIPKNYTWSAA